MRALVFASVFAVLSGPAFAQAVSALSACTVPGASCSVINAGPCGSIMTNDIYGVRVHPPGDPRVPSNVSGACGFITPPAFAIDFKSPRWCQTAADCSYTVDKCGVKRPVNAQQQQTAQLGLMTENRSCSKIDTRPVVEERCVANLCEVTLGR